MHLIEIRKQGFHLQISSPKCPLFVCSELSLKTAHEHLSTAFLNVHKKYMGHDVRKNCLQGFENNKGADQSVHP